MTLYIAPVVEGHTEVLCIERILHRVWNELFAAPERLQVVEATRGDRSSLVSNRHPALGEKIEQALSTLVRHRRRDPAGRGLVLLLLDAEEECPAKLAQELGRRAVSARSDADIACVLAKRALENWFKAAASSLAGCCGLPTDLTTPLNPEEGNGAAWLTAQMRKVSKRRQYAKPDDALQLARHMNLAECHANSRSFRKLCKELEARLPPATESPCTPSA